MNEPTYFPIIPSQTSKLKPFKFQRLKIYHLPPVGIPGSYALSEPMELANEDYQQLCNCATVMMRIHNQADLRHLPCATIEVAADFA